MSMYAIIETGGKAIPCNYGDVLNLEKLAGNKGDKITFDKVLLVAGAYNNVLVGKALFDCC